MVHAICLAALNVKEGKRVVHIGAGAGYYTAVQARLTGESGTVAAFEIEKDLSERAANNRAGFSNVNVQACSGAPGELPDCEAIYVNAGATAPLDAWLDALRPNGRLLFPLTPNAGPVGMPGPEGFF